MNLFRLLFDADRMVRALQRDRIELTRRLAHTKALYDEVCAMRSNDLEVLTAYACDNDDLRRENDRLRTLLANRPLPRRD